MKIAGSTLIFTRSPLLQAIGEIASLGFEHVDLALFEGWANMSPPAVVWREQEVATQIQAACRQDEIAPAGFNLNLGETGIELQAERLHSICFVARPLGVRVLAMKTSEPTVRSVPDEMARPCQFVEVGERQGIQVTVESHVDTDSEDPNTVLQFLRAVPGLEFTLDLAHFAVGPFWEQGYEELLPYVCHAHLRSTGRTRDELQVPLGKGSIDFEKLILDFHRHGFTGAMSVEIVDTISGIDDYPLEARLLKDHVGDILVRHHIPLK